MKERGEKTGHAHEPAECKAIEKTKPSRVGFPQNGRDSFPFGRFTAAWAVFGEQSKEHQHNHHRKHGEGESVGPSELLSEAGRK